MRIITVNLPESYLKAIDSLTGDLALYPSRSELVRVAVREFLISELQAVNNFTNSQPIQNAKDEIKKELDKEILSDTIKNLNYTQEYRQNTYLFNENTQLPVSNSILPKPNTVLLQFFEKLPKQTIINTIKKHSKQEILEKLDKIPRDKLFNNEYLASILGLEEIDKKIIIPNEVIEYRNKLKV